MEKFTNSQIGKLTNFENWKMYEFPKFYNFENSQIYRIFSNLKNENSSKKMANFRIICPIDIPHHSKFRQFLFLPFDINQFRCLHLSIFISYFSVSRKFGCSIFERSLTLTKCELSSAILNFFCSKFKRSCVIFVSFKSSKRRN